MKLIIYSTQDEVNVLHKTITQLGEYTGNPRSMDQIGMQSTDFVLNTSDISLLQNGNYMYAEELGRYYYIGERKSRVNGLWVIECTVDPLMSLSDQINNLEGIVKRSASVSDALIVDEQDICYQNPHKVYKNFSSGFGNDSSIILMTI